MSDRPPALCYVGRMIRSVLALAVLLTATACTRPAPVPPPPTGLKTIGVAPPANRTGQALIVRGNDGVLGELLEQRKQTVPDVLGAEARKQLELRGFRVPTTPGSAPAVLQMDLRRWQPDPELKHVLVDITASLVEGKDRVLWTVTRERWNVDTKGSSQAEAYDNAAEAVVEELLRGWAPGLG